MSVRAAAFPTGLSKAVLILALVALTMSGSAPPPRTPRLIVGESVADDFRALAEETWAEFLAVFRYRTDCFGDVRLRAVYDLDSRAAYDPTTATVFVRVPGSPALLRSALVHEWAHHVEFQCPAQRALRAPFLAAQGQPPETPWRPAGATAEMPNDEWAAIPSEQYAEATVALVLGRRQIPTKARVAPEAVEVVRRWAAGEIR